MGDRIELAIKGMYLSPIKIFEDERGALLKIMKSGEDYFDDLQEIYISETKSGVVKGWKLHKVMSQNFTVPNGELRLVVFDGRKNSPTKGSIVDLTLSRTNFSRVHIPSNLWYSFKAISQTSALILNCSSLVHDPKETESLPIDTESIPFNW